jgi:hypothetical protein
MVPMTEGRGSTPGPLQQGSRRRWAIAGGVAACWLVLELVTGSVVSATVLLVVIAVAGAACVGMIRAMGIASNHPWLRHLGARPQSETPDLLRVAMQHASDVFVITPTGSKLAPDVVELQLNPADYASLCERMDLGMINETLTEAYQEQVAAQGARYTGNGQPDAYVVADESVSPGRYRLRQGYPVSVGQPQSPPPQSPPLQPPQSPPPSSSPEFAYTAPPPPAYAGPDALTMRHPQQERPDQPKPDDMATVMERTLAPVPVLRLVTGSSVAETQMSGARAGRGAVELVLPDVPTVSREHAKFTFSDGRWWITNQGRNGLTLNDAPVTGEQPLSDGDAIRWGMRPDAPLSQVEIGWGPRTGHLSSRCGDGSAFPVVRCARRLGDVSA